MDRKTGIFKGWMIGKRYGFIVPDDGTVDAFVHANSVHPSIQIRAGMRVTYLAQAGPRGVSASEVVPYTASRPLAATPNKAADPAALPVAGPIYRLYEGVAHPVSTTDSAADAQGLLSEDLEELDLSEVQPDLLREISQWKREAKAEDNDRYFWHVREADAIASGDRYFVIGRKGCGKTALCEYFNRPTQFDIFSEKLSFKNFPFNELYSHHNEKFTQPNQFITIWKYLIYSTVCRLMLKNQALDSELRNELSRLYDDETPLSRRIGRWVGQEFGVSLFGLSVKATRAKAEPKVWIEHVDFLEDLLLKNAGAATYYVLFDELDEDYRDLVESKQYEQFAALITSLFKAVQDVRSTFGKDFRIFPVIFLRDDIYQLVQDSDKNKWGDFRVDLSWDSEKIKHLIAFRISRALDPNCEDILPFPAAWTKVFGRLPIGVGKNNKRISTYEFICRSTLLRPRDFVTYLQNCAQYAVDNGTAITPRVVKLVDKGFSNYLRQELADELFAILPDIENIFDAISQLRKWNFSISELQTAYNQQVENGFIKEKNVKYVLQVLFLFSVIGNTPRVGRYIFRYQNREARLNFNERVVVHRGLFKALQIL